MQETLYNFIKNHIDEDGFFTESFLPDGYEYDDFMAFGQADALYYSMEKPADFDDAGKLVQEVRAYLAEPRRGAKVKLTRLIKESNMAEYADSFVSGCALEEGDERVLRLARRYFYESKQREAMKFAFLLFGIYGMRSIEEEDAELWRDLLDVAHCEEFTFAFLYACRVREYQPQRAIWELLGCTKGWGKVFAVLDCRCADAEQCLWLLRYGPDITVEYPPLAVKFIQETHLGELLRAKEIDYQYYRSAVAILINYLQLLLHYPPEQVRGIFNLEDIDLYALLRELLRHAGQHAAEAEDVLDLFSVADLLRGLREEDTHYGLTPNQSSELLGTCDKLVYAKDWRAEIESGLLVRDEEGEERVDYVLADLAMELELDIWQRLHDFWLEHPSEYPVLSYLLAYDDAKRSRKVLAEIDERLEIFLEDAYALVLPLHYLRDHPGKGKGIIIFALNSPFELVRSCACDVLEAWDRKYFTKRIREALLESLLTSTDEVVRKRLLSLLRLDEEGLKL